MVLLLVGFVVVSLVLEVGAAALIRMLGAGFESI